MSGASNAWLSGENLGEGLVSGLEAGGYGAAIGGVIGGLTGGIDAYRKDLNVWTGIKPKPGRTQFSFSNNPHPNLLYLDENNQTITIKQFHDPKSRRINKHFWDSDGNYSNGVGGGTCDRFTHEIDLEDVNNGIPSSKTFTDLPRIKGYVGIEYDGYYVSPSRNVTFTSNNGLNVTLSDGPGNVVISNRNLQSIKASMSGLGINDGNVNNGF